MKSVTFLNRCKLSEEKKEEILEFGQRASCGEAIGLWYRGTFYITNNKKPSPSSRIIIGNDIRPKRIYEDVLSFSG